MDSRPAGNPPPDEPAASPSALAEPAVSPKPASDAPSDAGAPQPEDTGTIEFGDERVREAVREGIALVIFFVALAGALWYWIGASSANSFWMALLNAFWPWSLPAFLVGGLVRGTRCALRVSRESGGKPLESGEAFAAAAGTMWVMARGALKETKEDGQESLLFFGKAVVVIAAIVLLLLVFEPSILEDLLRWLERNL